MNNLYTIINGIEYVFTNTTAPLRRDTRSIFKAEFNGFDFKVFLLLDWLPNEG